MRPEYFGEHMMWWLMPMFPIVGMIICVIVIVFVVKLIMGGGKPCIKSSETPLDILKKRYASGEINREEFNKIKEDIM